MLPEKIKGGARVFQPKAKHHAVFESHTGIRGFMTMTNSKYDLQDSIAHGFAMPF
jgi:hypothetical protein